MTPEKPASRAALIAKVRRGEPANQRVKPAHVITPKEATFLMELWGHSRSEHPFRNEGMAASESKYSNPGLVRKRASELSKGRIKYVVSNTFTREEVSSKNGRVKTLWETRYRVNEDVVVSFPESALFLTQILEFPQNDHREIGIEADVLARLADSHGFTAAMFHKGWLIEHGYIEVDKQIRARRRVVEERNFLSMLALRYSRPRT